ncbi:MAG: DUF6141 family protein [Chloroherpetonaceae bacterium]|nr:DUF6141 family protein [Chthonomonadaceae bacterium]MDW8207368.1 DUF6141 family protein [Chloroherpetonaceae bacterium]
MSTYLFREEQKIAPAVMRAVLCINLLTFGGIAIAERRIDVIYVALLPIGLIWLIAEKMRLITEVRDDGLYVRLLPFGFRRIPFEDITSATVRRYRPLLEYGGWGIRYGREGMAYNASGNRGVQLVLHSGQRILIGSQQPEELLIAIEHARRR